MHSRAIKWMGDLLKFQNGVVRFLSFCCSFAFTLHLSLCPDHKQTAEKRRLSSPFLFVVVKCCSSTLCYFSRFHFHVIWIEREWYIRRHWLCKWHLSTWIISMSIRWLIGVHEPNQSDLWSCVICSFSFAYAGTNLYYWPSHVSSFKMHWFLSSPIRLDICIVCVWIAVAVWQMNYIALPIVSFHNKEPFYTHSQPIALYIAAAETVSCGM